MKYVAEVIDLLAAYPGREFKTGDIIRHATGGKELPKPVRGAARQAVLRAVNALIESGNVSRLPSAPNVGRYVWKNATCSSHEVRQVMRQ